MRNFANNYNNMVHMNSFNTKFGGQTKYVLRVRVCLVSKTVLWAMDNLYYVREWGYRIDFSVNVWSGTVKDIVVGPCILPDGQTAQR